MKRRERGANGESGENRKERKTSSDEFRAFDDGLTATATNEEAATTRANNEEAATIVDPTTNANANALSNTPTAVDLTTTMLLHLGLTLSSGQAIDDQIGRLHWRLVAATSPILWGSNARSEEGQVFS